MSILAWLGKLLGGSGSSKPTPTTSAQVATLPSLPTSSVAAVADAVVEAGRIVEQQTALHNTPAMQQGTINLQEQTTQDKLTKDVSDENVNAVRNNLAD